MRIPVGQTAVPRDDVPRDEVDIYFVHHFEEGCFLIMYEDGLRVYLHSSNDWGNTYYRLLKG